MAQLRQAPHTYTAGETLAAFRRVKLDGATGKQVVYADAGEPDVGVVDDPVTSGDPAPVCPPSAWSTVKLEASAAIEIHEDVYGTADGKIGTTPVGLAVGAALQAASASGSVIEVLRYPQRVRLDGPGPGVHGFHEDFEANSLDANRFVATATDGGAVSHSDGVGGVIQLQPSSTTVVDNDEIYLHQTLETFKFALGKPLVFEARVKVTEANTDDANVIVGLADAVDEDQLQDNGGGPAASYSGAVFFKVDGGTVWQAETSIGTTQSTDTNVGTATTATWFTMRIEFEPGSGLTDGTVRFYLDGALVHTSTSFDYTSATDMEAFVGVKDGGANEELVDVDYIRCWQAR